MLYEFAPYTYPSDAIHSVHLETMTAKNFAIKTTEQEGSTVNVRVAEIIPARVGTFEKIMPLTVKNGELHADSENDVLKVAVFERHHNTGTVGYGFTKGFSIKNGALAQTVAHDAHNLLVVGSNDEDMAIAANALIASGGGLVAVQNGKILGQVALPIAGLMSDKPLEEMSAEVEKLEHAWVQMGSALPSPFMTMALIPLACLPELRITNRGLVDCRTFQFVDLIVK